VHKRLEVKEHVVNANPRRRGLDVRRCFHRRRATFERCLVFVGGVRLGVWGVVLAVCVCVSVSGVLFYVGVPVDLFTLRLTSPEGSIDSWEEMCFHPAATPAKRSSALM